MTGDDISSSKSLPTIRLYTPDDCDATVEIFLRAIREVASKDYGTAEIDAWAKVEDREAWAARRASRPTWIAEIDGRPAGFTDLEPDGHLDMMFVHPDYQGMGIASRLLQAVETQARIWALSRLFAEASLTARPFFERRGFVLIAEQSVEKRGQRLTNFRMEKRI
ncbi:acetyltransferase [Rhizobium sp. Root708]|uniref:GNAT family N-acetyltransferase n=1 Tax=Rhizobium sp. Root708 TaxID=1736592 RepID=UPI0006F25992|nr:GNAT family N-acetyltransferase [Rhizobium sp. Root708]KRB50434.1 acetyltransferase [Rhizobium sp. Root708]